MNEMTYARAGGPPVRQCPSCQREWGMGVCCQACGQVEGFPVGVRTSSPGKRLGAAILDNVLMFVTLFIGWLVWQLIIAGRGQSPAKQLLNMRVVHLPDSRPASWWRMALREVIAKPVIQIASVFTLFVLQLWLLWDKNKQELWDKMVDTVVVDDPHGQMAPVPLPPPHPGGVALPPAAPTYVPPGEAVAPPPPPPPPKQL